MISARDYQAEARTKILAAWGEKPWYTQGETYRSCLLNIPTSAGKTIIAGLVAEAIGGRGRFLYLADRDVLCAQPRDKFARMLGIQAALEKAEDRAGPLAPVVVGSIQTLSRDNRLGQFGRDHFQYIFVDEAHRSVEQAKKITDYFRTAKVCGQTATAFRAKLKDLSAYYETVAYEIGLFSLIEAGYIVPIKVLTLPVEVDLSDVRQTATPDGQDYDAHELDTKIAPYYRRICELIVEHCRDRQILCFLPLIKSSQEFVTIARAAGINARHIDGQMSKTDKDRILYDFESRRFQLISNSSLLSTGWDCPPCDTLLNLSPTRSTGLWRQKTGRIVRVLPGVVDGIATATARRAAIMASPKPSALILDLLYHAEKFGLQGPADLVAANVGERQAIQKRLDIIEEEFDLQEVASVVQEEREDELKKELEAAARRKSDGLVDAKYYATLMHDRALMDYEPVMHWHTEKVSDKQSAFLERNGIDPVTVQDRGHAFAISSKIWGRKKLNLASYRTVVALEAKKVPGATHYSEEQAYRLLGNDYPFPFGMPAKRKWSIGTVPASYWRWLSEQPWVASSWPLIWKHMQEIGVVNSAAGVKTEE